MCTGRERNHPDIEELLVRHSPEEVLPPVVSAAGAPRVVVVLLEQRPSALLPIAGRPGSEFLARPPQCSEQQLDGGPKAEMGAGGAQSMPPPLLSARRIESRKAKTNPSSGGRWPMKSAGPVGHGNRQRCFLSLCPNGGGNYWPMRGACCNV